ncbi:MAG: hypothetical protein AABY22_08255 [Nanoarchaeota archaeon]
MDRDLLVGLIAIAGVSALVVGVNLARGVEDYYRTKRKLLEGKKLDFEIGFGGRFAFKRYREGKFGNYDSRK